MKNCGKVRHCNEKSKSYRINCMTTVHRGAVKRVFFSPIFPFFFNFFLIFFLSLNTKLLVRTRCIHFLTSFRHFKDNILHLINVRSKIQIRFQHIPFPIGEGLSCWRISSNFSPFANGTFSTFNFEQWNRCKTKRRD